MDTLSIVSLGIALRVACCSLLRHLMLVRHQYEFGKEKY